MDKQDQVEALRPEAKQAVRRILMATPEGVLTSSGPVVKSRETHLHERLEQDRYACFRNKPRSWVRIAKNVIGRIHADKAEHIPSLVY